MIQYRISTCNIVRQVGIGAEERGGGDRMVYCPIAWLPPWHDPGADGVVATTARQQTFFGLGTFWIEDAISGSRRGHVGSDATEGRAEADVSTRAAQSDSASVAQASLSWTSDSSVASGRGPGRRPGTVTAVTKPAAT